MDTSPVASGSNALPLLLAVITGLATVVVPLILGLRKNGGDSVGKSDGENMRSVIDLMGEHDDAMQAKDQELRTLRIDRDLWQGRAYEAGWRPPL